MDLLNRYKYIFMFQSSLRYRIGYIVWEFTKFVWLILWKKLKPSFPSLLKWDYLISNSIGKFQISEPSDMHSIVNPYTEKELFKYFIENNEWIFLDIWANIWKYTVMVWNKTNMKIFAFEPNPIIIQKYLRPNIKLNLLQNRVELIEYWLWNSSNEFELNIPNNSFWQASLIGTNLDINNLTKTKIKVKKLDELVHEFKIETNKISLIKIDVEWYEYEVVLGSQNTLSCLSDCTLIIEIFQDSPSKNDTINLIQSCWFSLIDLLYEDNYIFIKKATRVD